MKKRAFTLFLALLMLGGSMASCGESEVSKENESQTTADIAAQGETPVTPKSESETEPPCPVVERNFDGYEFRFLNGNAGAYPHHNLVIEEETADGIDSAFYNRNMITGERFQITFSEYISSNPQADYSRSILTDDYSFDVATLRMEWAFPCVVENQVMNWANIPNIDLTQPWWVQNSITNFSLMNNVYFAVSAFDITHYDTVRTFCFNKNLIEEYKMESPYDLINEGKWTLEKYYDMNMAFASDANGDGKWNDADLYGTNCGSNGYINTLMAGIDSILSIDKDENDLPYFNLDDEYHMERILKVNDMMKDRDHGLCGGNFVEGNALFWNGLIMSVAGMREMEDEFGIIPTPKYNEEQEEYINLGGSPFFMTVPTISPDLDRTGAILEGLAYDSLGIVDVAYYDKLLKGKTSRDEESTAMLDLIFSTLEYYHPLANQYLNAPMADDLVWNSSSRIASYFAMIKKRINGEIDEALTTYRTNMGIAADGSTT